MTELKISGNYTFVDENSLLNNKCINVNDININNNNLTNSNNIEHIYINDEEFNINEDISENINKNNYVKNILDNCIENNNFKDNNKIVNNIKDKINNIKDKKIKEIKNIENINNDDYLYSDEHIEYILMNNNEINNFSLKKQRKIIIFSLFFFLNQMFPNVLSLA